MEEASGYHLYLTVVDAGFGAALGIVVEFVVDLIKDMPATLWDSGVFSVERMYLTVESLALSLVLSLLVIVKWAMYRETIVEGFRLKATSHSMRELLDEKMAFLVLYLIIEFLLMISPIVYLSCMEIYLRDTSSSSKVPPWVASDPWALSGNLFLGLLMTINYISDLYITLPERGFYSFIIRRLNERVENVQKTDEIGELNYLVKRLCIVNNKGMMGVNILLLILSVILWLSLIVCNVFRFPQSSHLCSFHTHLCETGRALWATVIAFTDLAASTYVLHRIRIIRE